VVIEAVGSPATYRAAVEHVGFTGRVVCIGYAKEDVSFPTRLFVQKELDIMGSRNATPRDFAAVTTYLRQGLFPVERVISVRAPLADAGAALQRWADQPAVVTKILVDVG
jgi:threonine dehydrogenase-like Zn-dependent dehydrogenase